MPSSSPTRAIFSHVSFCASCHSAISRLCYIDRQHSSPQHSAMRQVILDTILQQLNQLKHIWRSLDSIVLVGGAAHILRLSAFISDALNVKVWTPPPPARGPHPQIRGNLSDLVLHCAVHSFAREWSLSQSI